MPQTMDIVAAALQAHQAGHRDRADKLYRDALDADPREPTALYLYGLLNFEAGRAERALELFEQVVALRPDHAEAQTTLANLHHWRGAHARAIEGYRRAAVDPHRADAAVGLANALRESGDAAGAVAAAAFAAQRFPTEPTALIALGAAHMAAGDPVDGVGAYQAAVDIDPSQAPARSALALALLAAGRAEVAAEEAHVAVGLDAASAEAWFARGAALLALSRADEALAPLRRSAALDSSRAATQLNLGAAYAALDDAQAAERALKAALALDPSLAEAHASLGSVYFRARRKSAAEDHWRRALALDPDLAGPHQNLAALLDERGRSDEAKRHRDKAYAGRNFFVEPASSPLATVLMPTTAESGNVPLDHLMPRDRFTRLRWVIAYEPDGEARALPPYDLVFNAIGDPDLADPTAEPMRCFLGGQKRPVLNPPDKVARTRRDRLPELLAGLPGVIVPPVARTSAREGLGRAVARAGLAPPLLIRPAGSHGGRGLELVTTTDALDALAPTGDAYATAFRDYGSADGAYRKYRVIFVDRRPYPYHLAISRDWLVHYESAGMTESAAWRAEEERYLDDPRTALGEDAMAAIAAIGERLDLDYGGVDFSLTAEGQVLVFEANATMLVHPEPPDSVFSYKNRAVTAIGAAFASMLSAAAARS